MMATFLALLPFLAFCLALFSLGVALWVNRRHR